MSKASYNNNTISNLLINNTLWLYGGKIITQIISFVVSILVIRKLSVDIFGTFHLLAGAAAVVAIFAVDPIMDTIFRYLPEFSQLKQFRKIKRFTMFSTLISGLLLGITLSVMYMFSEEFVSLFNIPGIDGEWIYFLIFAIFNSFERIGRAVLSSLLLHQNLTLIDVARSILRSLMLVYFFEGLNLQILLVTEAIVSVVFIFAGSIVFFKHLSQEVDLSLGDNLQRSDKKRILRYGMLSALNGFGLGLVSRTSDYFIVASQSNAYQVGLYSFAFQIYNLIFKLIPLQEFYSVLRPIIFRRYSTDAGSNEHANLYNFIVKMMIPLYVLPTVYFFAFGKSLITLIYDVKYIESYWVTLVVLISFSCTSLFYPVGLFIMQKERMEISLYSKIVAFFSLFAGIYAMKTYGIIGVASVTLLSGLLKDFLMYIMLKKYVPLKFYWKQYKNYIYQLFFLTTVFFIVGNYIKTLLALIIGSIFFTMISIGLLLKFHPFSTYDIKLLKKMQNDSKLISQIARFVVFLRNIKLSFK